ncbi:MAG: L,D-transpeptidase, partial [Lysobacteraceae bacterium]
MLLDRAKARRAIVCLALVATVSAGAAVAAAPPLSSDAGELHAWIQRSHDHRRMPFAIVDKRHARLHVFDAGGRLVGSSAVLLGATVGDHIVAGVGERAQRGTVRWDERTTPAGRFVSEPGENTSGEHVVWVDYDSAFAIHRLRPGRSFKSRELRLASPA